MAPAASRTGAERRAARTLIWPVDLRWRQISFNARRLSLSVSRAAFRSKSPKSIWWRHLIEAAIAVRTAMSRCWLQFAARREV